MHIIDFFKKLFKRTYLICALSGILMGLAMTFSFLFFLVFVSAVPFCYAIFTSTSIKKTTLCFFVYALSFYLVSYSWFLALHPLDWLGIEGKYSLLSAVAIWVFASFAHTLGLSFAGFLYAILMPKLKLRALFFCALYAIWEFVQQFSQLAFPWAKLAVAVANFLPFAQSANLFGASFLSLIVLSINSLFALAIISKKSRRALCIAAALVLSINFVYGAISLIIPKTKESTIKAAAIQANVNPVNKWSNEVEESMQRYASLTKDAANSGAKLIVFPETAIPTEIYQQSSYDIFLRQLAFENDVTLIVGSFGVLDEQPVNIMRMYYKDKTVSENIYAKRSIVPLGEYLPKGVLMDLIIKNFPSLSATEDIARGKTAQVFIDGEVRVAPLICYDSVFPYFSRQSSKMGANLLFIGTNDAYYRNSANARQHYLHAKLRAIESGKNVLRAANTGISGIIDGKGRTATKLKLGSEGYVIADVSLTSSTSFYHKTGEVVIIFAFAAVGFICALKIFNIFSKKR